MPLSASTIKFISSLRLKKVRQNYNKFTAEGPRIVGELLEQERYRVVEIFALPEWAEEQTVPPGVALTVVSPKELGRMSQLKTANKVIALVDMPTPPPPGEQASYPPPGHLNDWLLYLDGMQSPGNLGAVLRIADWFGFRRVVGGPGTADLYNSKTVQASMGSFLRVHYEELTLEKLVERYPEVPVFAADLEGESIFTFSPPPAGIMVIGAEGMGVSEGAWRRVGSKIHIPRGEGGAAESLNAAVATGLICGQLAAKIGKLM